MTGVREPLSACPIRLWECATCRRTFVAEGRRCPLCGEATTELASDGRGRLVSWTTVHVGEGTGEPHVLGWAELEQVDLGVLGRVVGEASGLRRGLPVLVHQVDGGGAWPQVWLQPEGDG